MPKYILEVSKADETFLVTFDERPTMEFIKTEYGLGTHTLYNGEGKVLRIFHVVPTKTGGVKITGVNPDGLQAVSTLNLHRLVKQYVRIIKVWPAKLNDGKALQKELQHRDTLIEDVLEQLTKAQAS